MVGDLSRQGAEFFARRERPSFSLQSTPGGYMCEARSRFGSEAERSVLVNAAGRSGTSRTLD
jgi:hypothetical protein